VRDEDALTEVCMLLWKQMTRDGGTLTMPPCKQRTRAPIEEDPHSAMKTKDKGRAHVDEDLHATAEIKDEGSVDEDLHPTMEMKDDKGSTVG